MSQGHSHSQEELEETWQWNVMWYPGWDPKTENKKVLGTLGHQDKGNLNKWWTSVNNNIFRLPLSWWKL